MPCKCASHTSALASLLSHVACPLILQVNPKGVYTVKRCGYMISTLYLCSPPPKTLNHDGFLISGLELVLPCWRKRMARVGVERWI